VPGDRAGEHRDAHQREADEHPDRLGLDERAADRPHADVVEREQHAAGRAGRGERDACAAGDPQARVLRRRRRVE
jgi:hypothetical protein